MQFKANIRRSRARKKSSWNRFTHEGLDHTSFQAPIIREVVEGRTPRHRGVLMGRVIKVVSDSAILEPASANSVSPLKPGDGVVFDAASWRSPQEREEGGHVYAVSQQRDGNLIVRFGNRDVNFDRVRSGDLVWRTHDPELDKAVRPYLQPAAPVSKQPIRVKVVAREGSALNRIGNWLTTPTISVCVDSASPLGSARQPRSRYRVSSGTIWTFGSNTICFGGD